MSGSSVPPDLPSTLWEAVPELVGAAWSPMPGLTGVAWCATPPGGEPLVLRPASATEAEMTCAASEVAAPVRAAADGWLVTRRLDGPHLGTLEAGRPPVLAELAALLRRLHRVDVALPSRPLAPQRARYAAAAASAAPRLVAGLGALAAAADRLEASLGGGPSVPAHLDVMANVLRTPDGLRLIDFEYAAAAPPDRELGQLVWEAELSASGADQLVAHYWGGDAGAHRRAVLGWTLVAGVTWTLWAAGRPALSRWARRSAERIRTHWAWPPAVDDTP